MGPRSLGCPRRLVAYGPDPAPGPGTRAGTRVTVWTDRRGGLASAPLSPADAAFRAVMMGGIVAVGAGATMWGSGRIVRVCLARQRLRQWDEEWERADTRRGGKTG